MSLSSELAAVLVAAGLGTVGTSIFTSLAAKIPTTGDGPFYLILEQPGQAPLYIQNSFVPNWVRPNAQIIVRHINSTTAKTKARDVYNLLAVIRNQNLSGVRYQSVKPINEPGDLGSDDNGRARWVFNLEIVKKPS